MSKHFVLDPDMTCEDWASAKKLAKLIGQPHDVVCGGRSDYRDCVAFTDCTCPCHLEDQ